MTACAIISESCLDRGALYQAMQNVNGNNYTRSVDASPGKSRLEDDASILSNFAGRGGAPVHAMVNIGIMFAGVMHEIAEIVEYTRGMPHIDCGEVPSMARVTMCNGTVDQWSVAIGKACEADKLSVARTTFTQVYKLLCMKGFGEQLGSYQTRETTGGILLLEKK